MSAPTKAIPKDTAGLKRPPETRKKIHALTARLKPNAREIYSKLEVLTAATVVPFSPSAVAPVTDVVGMLATLVAPRARSKNKVVPTYSPIRPQRRHCRYFGFTDKRGTHLRMR